MIDAEKASARKAAFTARKGVFKQGFDAPANAHLLEYLADRPPSIISAYMPIRTELSPLTAMAALHEQGHQVCVPVIVGKAQPLAFHIWTPDADMVAGPFGASVPKSGAVVVPQVVITPLLSFDARGYRLGYGGGFYDRSFEQIRQKHPVQAIGFAFSAQQVDRVPTNQTDYRLDMVVTENGCLSFG